MKNFKAKLKRELKETIEDLIMAIPLWIMTTIFLLYLIFEFDVIIYCSSLVITMLLSNPWINFIDKKFKKHSKNTKE
jgi:hypothetical protein